MKTRLAAVLVGVLALLAGGLAAQPAVAASNTVRVLATYITVDSKGYGTVPMKCSSSKACNGALYFADNAPVKVKYALKPWQTSYVRFRMSPSSGWNPHRDGTDKVGEVQRVRGAKLRVAEYKPRVATRDWGLTVDTRLPGGVQQIVGKAVALGGSSVSDVEVEINQVVRGRVVPKFTRNIGSNGTFVFNVPVDQFNRPKAQYVLRISGTTSTGERRSWWWRGSSNQFAGGAGGSRFASKIKTGLSNYVADFRWGVVRGEIDPNSGYDVRNAQITLTAPVDGLRAPNASVRKDLEIEGCANTFGSTRTNSSGGFKFDFVPTTVSSSGTAYGIRASYGRAETWSGRSPSVRWGSCNGLLRYGSYNKSNLIPVDDETGIARVAGSQVPGQERVIVPLYAPSNKIAVTKVSRTNRTSNDHWVTIRDRVPGVPVLEAPIVAQGAGSIFEVQPGTYWVETGRRTGCSAWVPTRYPDNNGIFKDEARDAERWKVIKGSKGNATAYRHGYRDRKPPKGYVGWMYRDHCKSLTSGTITTLSVGNGAGDRREYKVEQKRGAVVSGTVKRKGGKTNKELLVRLTSGNRVLVYRTDLTDGKGRFYIGGLASGTYQVSVNADSWRGNKQGFSGRKTIKVTQGKSYSLGTLVFQE